MEPRIAQRAAAARRIVHRVTAVLCGALLLTLTAVTVVDVVGRYLLASPLPGGPEYTEILLMAIIFAGLPAVCLDDGHIAVDLFTQNLKGRLKMIQTAVARLFVAVVLAVIGWQLWHHAGQLERFNEVTIYLRAPLAPFCFAASIIVAASALLTFVMAVTRVPVEHTDGAA